MIKIDNIAKKYHSKKGADTRAIKNITLEFASIGLIFITGKSGCGKSTFLNILGGLDTFDSGEITIDGKNLSEFNKKDYDSYRNTYIGFVFQDYNLLDEYNVYENIELASKLQKKKIEKTETEALLKRVGLNGKEQRKINELSGGERQRVAIARALVKNSKIILADEPTGNLDSKTSAQIFELLKDISKEKLVIIVSHDKESAYKYGNRVVELSDGCVEKDSGEIEAFDIENSFVSKKQNYQTKRH